MKIGKLTNEDLNHYILSRIHHFRDDVILRPGIGEDCSAIAFNNELCIISTDPITATSKEIGKLGVHISCNDVASSGAEPIGILVTLLVPPDAVMQDIEEVMQDICDTTREMKMDILGGHTEITNAVNRIVLSVTVIGKTSVQNLVRTSGAQIGDEILITKWAAIEGTNIIINEFYEKIKNNLSEIEISKAQNLIHNISVVKEGLISAKYGVSSMHDITEGGVLGAIWEVAEASHKGVQINLDNIPILSITKKICSIMGIDPYRLMSSGSMLITCKNGEGLKLELSHHDISSAVIGKVIETERYYMIGKQQTKYMIKPTEGDELYKLF